MFRPVTAVFGKMEKLKKIIIIGKNSYDHIEKKIRKIRTTNTVEINLESRKIKSK